MSRRPPSTRTKPPAGWPAWLAEQRLAKGWKQEDVFERVRTHFVWGPNSVSLYGDIERGHRDLTYEDKVVLAAVFGKTPEDVAEPEAVEPPPDLATAIAGLTAELQWWRQGREDLEARVEGLGELVARLAAQVGAALPKHSVPAGTTE